MVLSFFPRVMTSGRVSEAHGRGGSLEIRSTLCAHGLVASDRIRCLGPRPQAEDDGWGAREKRLPKRPKGAFPKHVLFAILEHFHQSLAHVHPWVRPRPVQPGVPSLPFGSCPT